MNKPLFAAGMLALASGISAESGYGTKFIAHGWDTMNMTPDEVLANIDKLDQLQIDGMTLSFPETVQTDGTKIRCGTPATDPLWLRSTLEPMAETMRKITAHPSQKNDFLVTTYICYRQNGQAPLLDDEDAWERVTHNLAEVAWLAKAGGLKGLMIDNENYTGIGFARVPEGMPEEKICEAYRERGRQVFGAIFKEFPDVKLLFMWFFSEYRRFFEPGREAELEHVAKNGRQIAFYNGLLDVLPPTAEIIDGDETGGYTIEAPGGGFYRAAIMHFRDCQIFVKPENRAKYRAQIRSSFGMYLDEYVNGKIRGSGPRKGQQNHWYRGPVNGSRAERFRRTLEGAADAAEGYLWLYGEEFSFIDWGGKITQRLSGLHFNHRTTWDEKIGLSRKLALLRENPGEYVPKRLGEIKASGTEPNLLTAPTSFELEADGSNAVTKTFTYVDMTNRIPYAIDVLVKGDARVAAYWLRDGKWCLDIPPEWFVEATPAGEADADGWRRLTALVRGPSDVDTLSLQFTVKSGKGAFKDAHFIRFDTDAAPGRYDPSAGGSAAELMARADLQKLFGRHPKLWRIDGDVVVFQSTMLFGMMSGAAGSAR